MRESGTSERSDSTDLPAPRSTKPNSFIGRVEELKVLIALSEQARAGTGTVLRLDGAFGMGKSRLLDEYCAHLGLRESFRIECVEYCQTPFAALRNVAGLRDIASAQTDASSIAQAILNLAREKPGLTILIDDCHWADLGTLDVLRIVANDIRVTPLFIITSWDDDIITAARREAWSRIHRTQAVHHIKIQGLAPLETRELFLEMHDRSTLPENFMQIIDACGGNPFFMEQLLRNSADPAREGIPEALQAVIQRRLEGLDHDERAIADRAAVLGFHFNTDDVIAAGGEFTSFEVATRGLRRMIELGFIVRESIEANFRYRFANTILREALYEKIDDIARRECHGAIAHSLKKRIDGKTTPDYGELKRLAYHWFHSTDSTGALYSIERAITAAAFAKAYIDIPVLCDRALSLKIDDSKRLEFLLGKANALNLDGPRDSAIEAYIAVISLCESLGQDALATAVETKLGSLYRDQEKYELAEAAFLKGLRRTESLDDQTRFSSHIHLAKFYAFCQDVDQARKHTALAEALDPGDQTHDRITMFETQAMIYNLDGKIGLAIDLNNKAIDLAQQSGLFTRVIDAQINGARIAACGGFLAEAEKAGDAALRDATDRNLPASRFDAYSNLALIYWLKAEYRRGYEAIGEARKCLLNQDETFITTRLAEDAINIGLMLNMTTDVDVYHKKAVQHNLLDTADLGRLAPLAYAVANKYVADGQPHLAIACIESAGSRLKNIECAPWFALSAAEHGSDEQYAHVIGLIEKWAQPIENNIGRAYLALARSFRKEKITKNNVTIEQRINQATEDALYAQQIFSDCGVLHFADLAKQRVNAKRAGRRAAATPLNAGQLREVLVKCLIAIAAGYQGKSLENYMRLSETRINLLRSELCALWDIDPRKSRSELPKHCRAYCEQRNIPIGPGPLKRISQ